MSITMTTTTTAIRRQGNCYLPQARMCCPKRPTRLSVRLPKRIRVARNVRRARSCNSNVNLLAILAMYDLRAPRQYHCSRDLGKGEYGRLNSG
jgi:hypothetical protein